MAIVYVIDGDDAMANKWFDMSSPRQNPLMIHATGTKDAMNKLNDIHIHRIIIVDEINLDIAMSFEKLLEIMHIVTLR
jgi:hypothetical protein